MDSTNADASVTAVLHFFFALLPFSLLIFCQQYPFYVQYVIHVACDIQIVRKQNARPAEIYYSGYDFLLMFLQFVKRNH